MRLTDTESHRTHTSIGRSGEIGMLNRVETQYIPVSPQDDYTPTDDTDRLYFEH
jgi:hypothetical protein